MRDEGLPTPNGGQGPGVAKSPGYFEATRSDDALELIHASPFAFLLAYVIAARARWKPGFNRHNLEFGEAFLGDYKTCGMSERNYRTAKEHLAKWGFATFKPTNKGTVAKLIDTRLFKVNPGKDDGQNADQRRTADGQPTTNLNLKAGKHESHKAYSTKASKLSASQKELADRIEAVLGNEWVNDAGKWINRIKKDPEICERVIAEVESAAKETRIKTTPARYAEQSWKEFAIRKPTPISKKFARNEMLPAPAEDSPGPAQALPQGHPQPDRRTDLFRCPVASGW